jgi:hypothetical protein
VLASIRSAAVLGIAAYDVTVEVDVAAGLPAWTIGAITRQTTRGIGAGVVDSQSGASTA